MKKINAYCVSAAVFMLSGAFGADNLDTLSALGSNTGARTEEIEIVPQNKKGPERVSIEIMETASCTPLDLSYRDDDAGRATARRAPTKGQSVVTSSESTLEEADPSDISLYNIEEGFSGLGQDIYLEILHAMKDSKDICEFLTSSSLISTLVGVTHSEGKEGTVLVPKHQYIYYGFAQGAGYNVRAKIEEMEKSFQAQRDEICSWRERDNLKKEHEKRIIAYFDKLMTSPNEILMPSTNPEKDLSNEIRKEIYKRLFAEERFLFIDRKITMWRDLNHPYLISEKNIEENIFEYAIEHGYEQILQWYINTFVKKEAPDTYVGIKSSDAYFGKKGPDTYFGIESPDTYFGKESPDTYFGMDILSVCASTGIFSIFERKVEENPSILEKKIKQNSRILTFGQYLMHLALDNENKAVAQYLSQKKIIPDISNQKQKNNLFDQCCEVGVASLIEILIDMGARLVLSNTGNSIYHKTSMQIAAENGHLSVMQVLEKRGCRLTDIIKYSDYYELTLLHIAAQKGFLDIVEYLTPRLKFNIWRDMKSPLDEAAQFGHLPVVEHLIKDQAWVENHKDVLNREPGETAPIHYAVEGRHIEIVRYLISKGAEVNATNTHRETPLMLAISNKDLPMAEYLISVGADVNAYNVLRESTLTCAVKVNDLPMVKLLLSYKHTRIDSGAFRLARFAGYVDIWEYLDKESYWRTWRPYDESF